MKNDTLRTGWMMQVLLLAILDVGLILFLLVDWSDLRVLPLPVAPLPPSSASAPRVSTGDVCAGLVLLLTGLSLFRGIRFRQWWNRCSSFPFRKLFGAESVYTW